MNIDTSRRGFLGGLAATLLISAGGVRLAVPQPKPLLAANGWPICNGQLLRRADYSELFRVIGHIYGIDGDEFKLPDFGGDRPSYLIPGRRIVHAICPTPYGSSLPTGYITQMLLRAPQS